MRFSQNFEQETIEYETLNWLVCLKKFGNVLFRGIASFNYFYAISHLKLTYFSIFPVIDKMKCAINKGFQLQ